MQPTVVLSDEPQTAARRLANAGPPCGNFPRSCDRRQPWYTRRERGVLAVLRDTLLAMVRSRSAGGLEAILPQYSTSSSWTCLRAVSGRSSCGQAKTVTLPAPEATIAIHSG